MTVAGNQSPVVSAVTITEPDYCASGPGATVEWTYSDPDNVPLGFDPQTAFQLQVSKNGSCFSETCLVLDTTKIISSIDDYSFSGDVPPWAWNNTYKARVKVWDSDDAESAWVEQTVCNGSGCLNGGVQWKTPQHNYPQVSFSWLQPKPKMGDPIAFIDETVFAADVGENQKLWLWEFDDLTPTDSNQDPTHTFATAGSYNIKLTATDSNLTPNASCWRFEEVTIQRPLPVWKETNPK